MCKRFVFIYFSFLYSFFSFGQESIDIKGTIKDQNNKPLAFASIVLFQSENNQLISGSYSDEKGNYLISLDKSGDYYLVYRMTGFETDTLRIGPTIQSKQLETIKLVPIKSLETVEVTGQKSAVEYQIDKRVYNIDTDLNNQGANASEVLENIPSVTVDNDGKVSLRGSANVRILINGKISGFASTGDALKQLRSEHIEKIEVITNASSKHDAQGEGGIINIVLKKTKTEGLTFTAGLRASYFPELGADLKINYKNSKLNFFASYSGGYANRPGKSTTYLKLNNPDTAFTYRQKYNHNNNKLTHQGNAGFDFYLNDYNTLSTSFSIRSGIGNNSLGRTYEDLDNNDNITRTSQRDEKQIELEDLLEADLGYTRNFKKLKGEWSTSVKWFRDQDIEKSTYYEYAPGVADKNEYSQISTYENNLITQSDFTFHVFKNTKFETGVKLQGREMNNQFRFGKWLNNDWYHDSLYNDKYRYNEVVYAAYIMGSNTWNKFSMQAGLRGELSTIKTLKHNNGSQISKEYLDLFPNLALSYKRTEKQTFQLNYSRRINRPGQWELIPISRLGDNRERLVGNTNINPEYTHSTEFNFMQIFKSGSFLASVYYKNTDNKIERISELGSDGIVYITPYNAAIKNTIGIDLSGNYSPTNWMRINTGFNVYYDNIRSKISNFSFNKSLLAWTNRTSINFAFPKIIKAQIAFNYQAPTVRAQGKMLAVYYFDLGISKDFLKGNASIGLNIRDVFNTRRWRFLTDTPEIYTFTNGQWRQRTITLVFSYRFNQKKKESKATDFNLLEEQR